MKKTVVELSKNDKDVESSNFDIFANYLENYSYKNVVFGEWWFVSILRICFSY